MTEQVKIKAGIIGASGYTGADLIRLAACHPGLEISHLTAGKHAGSALGEVFPHLGGLDLPELSATEDIDWSDTDVVFCGLPHGTSQEVIAALPGHLKIIDLSADFRLRDAHVYSEWYGHEHKALHLQKKAVYGLTEYYRDDIAKADLVACPGCYPTAALLMLLPLVEKDLIHADDIVIDAKSGASGSGRGLKQYTLFCEVSEALHPYGIAHHRHAPEIEQELSVAGRRPLIVSFTPHLIPMNRGELLTTYVRLAKGVSAADLRQALDARYKDEPFVRVALEGQTPETQHIRGSNTCLLGVFEDRVPGRAILVSTLDNLVKGSSGQALQNFNLMFGFDETCGLQQLPLFP